MALALLTEGHHSVSLQSFEVLAFKAILDLLYLLHGLLGCLLELFVVGCDKLVAQAVEISSISSLTRQLILIFVKFLKHVLWETEPITKLFFCIVDCKLVTCKSFTDGMRFIWFVRLINAPEFAANLIADARRRQQFVISFKVDVDPTKTFILILKVLS